MKRLIAILLVVASLTGLLAGCGKPNDTATTPSAEETTPAISVNPEDLASALEYLRTIYKEVAEKTPADFERVSVLRVGADAYPITWTADADESAVKIVDNGNGTVTIDVNENNEQDLKYTLTASISDAAGNIQSYSWNHLLPGSNVEQMKEIVDMAYALDKGETLEGEFTLAGKIISVDSAWSDQYKNITVTISVEGREDKPVQCYRLKGDGAQDLAIGDKITVFGKLKNYNGTIEFDAGCQLLSVVKGDGEAIVAPTDPLEIMKEAFALKSGMALPYNATVTGVVTGIDTAYSTQYQNISVTIAVDGAPGYSILCYRLKGTGADTLNVNDIITVTGQIKNYAGTIEFATPSLDSVIQKAPPTQPNDPTKVVDAAYALGKNKSLPYTATLTGTVTAVTNDFSEQYKNVTIAFVVEGREDKPIVCYRLNGLGMRIVETGDIITVCGIIKNYYDTKTGKSTIEFDAGCKILDMWKGERVQSKDPTPDTEMSIADAMALGASKDHNTYTEGKYYVTGEITEVYNTTYGNMKIKDASGNILTVYGTYDATGDKRYDKMEVKPVAGDTVTVYGIIGQYNGTPQLKNGWITKHIAAGGGETEEPETPDVPDAPKDPAADSQLSIADAIALGASKEHNTYTQGKYYVTGQITEIYNTQYGNMKITDGKGNTLTVYGTYNEDGSIRFDKMETQPAVGETITVYGILGQYNGTAQMKNGWIIPAKVGGDPAADSELSISSALALGASKEHNTYTEGKYYVTGKITEVYNTQYGNMKISDENGNILTVYGTYDATGDKRYDKMEVKPVAGDTVTVYGIIGQYNGTAQIKNGWITKHVPAEGGETEEPEVPEVPEEPEVPAVDANSSLADVLNAAQALENNNKLDFKYTITGTIITSYGYNASYSNITVIMQVGDTTVQCYRLAGDGADQIAEGDTITVTGILGKNNSGYIRFEQGCTLDTWTSNT